MDLQVELSKMLSGEANTNWNFPDLTASVSCSSCPKQTELSPRELRVWHCSSMMAVAAEEGGAMPPGRTERGGGAKKAEEKKIERKTLKKSLKIKINRGRQTVRGAHLATESSQHSIPNHENAIMFTNISRP